MSSKFFDCLVKVSSIIINQYLPFDSSFLINIKVKLSLYKYIFRRYTGNAL